MHILRQDWINHPKHHLTLQVCIDLIIKGHYIFWNNVWKKRKNSLLGLWIQLVWLLRESNFSPPSVQKMTNQLVRASVKYSFIGELQQYPFLAPHPTPPPRLIKKIQAWSAFYITGATERLWYPHPSPKIDKKYHKVFLVNYMYLELPSNFMLPGRIA